MLSAVCPWLFEIQPVGVVHLKSVTPACIEKPSAASVMLTRRRQVIPYCSCQIREFKVKSDATLLFGDTQCDRSP